MAKKIDMTGWVMKEHGVPNSRIIVIEEDLEYTKMHIQSKQIYWKCKCNCGNIFTASGGNIRNGHTISCGCFRKETNALTKGYNLVGKKFNKLLVLEPVGSNNYRQRLWKCQCDCGNITYVITSCLTTGHTKSCGCEQKLQASLSSRKDIIGKKFGKLTVLSYLYSNNRGERVHLCKCDCGNTCEVVTSKLISGHTMSCGCIRSKGEEKIIQLLLKNNIPFKTQKVYDDLISPKHYKLKYDFLINNQFLLEFDGTQHFEETDRGNTTLEERQIYDKIKDEYAKSHNIPLKRIPYWDYDKITLENIMSDKWLINN